MKVVLRGGVVVRDDGVARADVVVVDGVIVEVGESLSAPSGAKVIDATDCWVGPGFVDLHSHLREPGREAAETVESGARAGAVGGFSAIVAMANTEPPLDSAALVAYVLERGRRAVIDVAVAGAITLGRRGERLAPIAEMAALGVRLFSDDGEGVQSAAVMRSAMEYARPLGVRLAQHCEEATLVGSGVMNEGALSSRLGLAGRPIAAEVLMVWRDLELVRLTGCPVHFMHLSCARSIELVAGARREGLPVTAEVTPHHLTLDESCVATFDPRFKVHPPLRGADEVKALRVALNAGEFDAVASDHAPHAPEFKELAFDEAPAGVLGLEESASLTFEALGAQGADPLTFFRVLSRGPARVAALRAQDEPLGLGAHGGSLRPGEAANVVVFDPAARWRVESERRQSLATNTPYEGRDMKGRARTLLVGGRVVLDEGTLT